MLTKKRSNNDAIQIARDTLARNKISYDTKTLDISYDTKLNFEHNKKSGWLISAKLNVPDSFEPNMIFITVAEDDEEVYIPDML